MRFNDKELITISQKQGDLTGRLSYTQFKGPASSYKNAGFRDRFFKLVGNLLFYFRFNDIGSVDYREPVGVIVLENYSVQPEYNVDVTFAFGILFLDEPDKRHVFTARTDSDVQLWISTLQTASYQHWSNLLKTKRSLLKALLESRQSAVSAPLLSASLEFQMSQGHASSSSASFRERSEAKLIPLDSNETVNLNIQPKPSQPPQQHSLPRPPGASPRVKKKEEDLIRF